MMTWKWIFPFLLLLDIHPSGKGKKIDLSETWKLSLLLENNLPFAEHMLEPSGHSEVYYSKLRRDEHRWCACEALGRIWGMITAALEKDELSTKGARGWPGDHHFK